MELKTLKLPFSVNKPILALGSQTKNTICFAKGNRAILSSIHLDLNNPKDFLDFEKGVKYFLKKRPKIIVYDLHPEYQPTKYALSLAARYSLLATQHHHAHIASCMAENGLGNQKVIGVAFDGTGLGADNNLWGAEFLVCNYKDFKRSAHLKEIPLLGGEKAILEPQRLVAAWLYGFDWVKKMDKQKQRVLKNMYLSGFNSPLASSMGRLFDTVGSLVLGKVKANFEAELAMQLEKTAARCSPLSTCYPFEVIRNNDGYILDPIPMLKQLLKDLKAKEPKEKIAYRFHLTVAQMIKNVSLILRKESRINKIVLSGGVFQNKLLLGLASDLLYRQDFNVFTHNELSCNDSGISLGQVAVATFRSSICV